MSEFVPGSGDNELNRLIAQGIEANWLSPEARNELIEQTEQKRRLNFVYELGEVCQNRDALPLIVYSFPLEFGPPESIYDGRLYRVATVLSNSNGKLLTLDGHQVHYMSNVNGQYEITDDEVEADEFLIPGVLDFVESEYNETETPKVFCDPGVKILRLNYNYPERIGLFRPGYLAGKPEDWKQMFPNHLGDRWQSRLLDIQRLHKPTKMPSIFIDGQWIQVETWADESWSLRSNRDRNHLELLETE